MPLKKGDESRKDLTHFGADEVASYYLSIIGVAWSTVYFFISLDRMTKYFTLFNDNNNNSFDDLLCYYFLTFL